MLISFPALFLETMDVKKKIYILKYDSNLFFSISSLNLQLVSCLELQLKRESCDSGRCSIVKFVRHICYASILVCF